MDVGVILGGVFVFAAGCSACAGQSSAQSGAGVKLSLGKRGTSTTFVKWQEIEIRDDHPRGRRPVPTELALRNLTKYDAIWCANFVPRYNRAAWRLLRKQNPNILTLHYISSDTALIGDKGCFDYDYINTHHPEWFMLKDGRRPGHADPRNPDNRARWTWSDPKAPNYQRFYLDVCNPEFQKWAAERIVEWVSGERERLTIPFHGLAADNVNIGRKAAQMISKGAPNWPYADRFEEWNLGFCKYLKTVKKALNERGFILVANNMLEYGADVDAECWNLFLDSVDGVLTERAICSSLQFGCEILYTDDAWLLSIEKHERILKKGLIDWWVCYPPQKEPAGHELFLYNYCSWLLTKVPGLSFFFATRGDPGYRSNPRVPWYEEYDLQIGDPTSARYQKGACWVREYSNALVVVNPTRRVESVRLGQERTWTDSSGRRWTSTLQMPPTSGRLLLPENLGPG